MGLKKINKIDLKNLTFLTYKLDHDKISILTYRKSFSSSIEIFFYFFLASFPKDFHPLGFIKKLKILKLRRLVYKHHIFMSKIVNFFLAK